MCPEEGAPLFPEAGIDRPLIGQRLVELLGFGHCPAARQVVQIMVDDRLFRMDPDHLRQETDHRFVDARMLIQGPAAYYLGQFGGNIPERDGFHDNLLASINESV